MKWPLVARSTYEEVVRQRDLYEVALGMRPSAEQEKKVMQEREMTDDEKAIAQMHAAQESDRQKITRIARTRPSQLGKEMAKMMAKWGPNGMTLPVKNSEALAMFAQAETEALKN